MNVERLHAIARAARDDLQATGALQHVRELKDALQNQVNQPGQPAFQQQVSQLLQQLDQSLATAAVNAFPPTWQIALEEIGGRDLLGDRLRDSIRRVFERNQITPSVALEEIQEIHSSLGRLTSAIDQLISAFEVLEVGAEDLEPGQCEIGVLVPRAAVKNKLDEFAGELVTLNKTFATFSELATGTRPGFDIRAISSTDLTVFLDLVPEIAACLAVAIERVVALYKQLLEIRRLRKELADQGLADKSLQGVDAYANSHMKEGIELLVDELIRKYATKQEVGRQNELRTELRSALNRIANRIDRGYNIEIRVAPLEERSVEGESDSDSPRREALTLALEAAKGVQFLRPVGEPILALPEPQAKEKPSDEKTA